MQPIKVLHIVPNMQAGGLETFIMNLMRNIDRSKIQFDFLVHYQSRKFYDDEIEKLGGKIYRFSLREDNNLFHYLYHLNKFFKEHQEYKIIHCHMESIGFLIFFIAKCHGIKVRIAHSHTINTENNLKGKIKYLLSKLIKYTSTDNLACSKQAGEYLFHDKPYQIIPNAIDLSKFSFDQNKRNQIREELKIEQSALVVGHIGRFNLAKNHTKLLDIFFEYQLTNSNSYLLLVGEGEEKNPLKKNAIV